MRILVKATTQQQVLFQLKSVPDSIQVVWYNNPEQLKDAAACFDLCIETVGASFAEVTDMPVFVNLVTGTHQHLLPNHHRINAWNGFFERPLLEMVPGKDASKAIEVLEQMGWRYQVVPDEPGMIAARVVAMIINEAYFALGEAVSTKADIDTAMKLGTNYPYGPFEWADKIGLDRIYQLLKVLGETDQRYAIAPALANEYEKMNP